MADADDSLEDASSDEDEDYDYTHTPASPQDIDNIIAEFDQEMRKTLAPSISGSPKQWWKKDADGAPAYTSPSRLAQRLHEVADELEGALVSKPKTVATTDIKPFPSLAEEALKDAEDPCRIYWDMTFVFRTISDEDRKKLSQEANEPPRKDFTPRKTHWRHHRKKKPFNHEVFVKKAQLAGLVTSSYLSTQEDEIYVRVGATHERLRNQADNIDFPMPLHEARLRTLARRGLPEQHIAPMDIPERTPPADGAHAFSRFRAFEYIHGKFDTKEELEPLYLRTHEHAYHGGCSERSLFNSMRRLKLIWSCLNDDRSKGGANIPIEKHVAKGKHGATRETLLAALAMHDRTERKYLFDVWVRAPWATPPQRMPLEAYKEYFGEKQGLLMAFKAHITQGYGLMAVFGIVVMLWWAAIHAKRDDKDPEDKYEITASGSIVIYAAVVALWSICNTEIWKRTERTYALEWGMVGYEEKEQRRPQFKGLHDMHDPVSGRPGAFYPPYKRRRRTLCGVWVTCLCIAVNLLFLLLCVWMKTEEGTELYFGLKGLGFDQKYKMFATVLNSFGILLFKEGYERIAVRLTDAENWMTDTVYADKLIAKLTAFNFINSYFSLFYVIFFMKMPGHKQDKFEKLQKSLIILLASVIVSTNMTGFALPYLKLYKKMAREGGIDAHGEEQKVSVPENSYMMVECDEQLDNIKATTQEATQYGYITLFSAAFPGAPLMAFVNNMFQMRTDGYKYLCTYRRIQPYGVEDIGTYQSIFELMNYTGVMSSFLSIIYRTTVIPKYWPERWGGGWPEHSPTKHQLDCVFMVCCGFFACVVLVIRLLIDDVPFDVELQIKRNDFLNSKIIDHVADEADAVVLADATHCDIAVHPRDAMEEYLTFDELFNNDDEDEVTDGDDGASEVLGPEEVVHPA